jgi:hypothetical protein
MKYIDGRSFDPYWIAYRQQRKNAKKRGIEFPIAFDDWKALWNDSGKWDLRGRSKGQYVMCRVGDVGPYAIGNVFIATNSENTRQASEHRVYTPEMRERISAAQKGVPHLNARGVRRGPMSDNHRQKIREAKTGTVNPNANKSVWTAMKTPLGVFKNGAEAARAFGITTKAAHLRCQSTTSTFQDWSYA